MEYGPNYKFQKGRKGILKDDPTIKISMPEAGLGLGIAAALGSYFGSKKKKKTSNVPLPKSIVCSFIRGSEFVLTSLSVFKGPK